MVSKPVFGLYMKSSKGCLHECKLNSVLNVNPVICIEFDSSTSICKAYSFINLNMSLVQEQHENGVVMFINACNDLHVNYF